MIEQMQEGEWHFEEVPCPCGGHEFLVVALQDRFGIPSPISICRRCGLLQSNPRLTEHAYVEFYTHYYRTIYMGLEPEGLFQEQRRRGGAILRAFQKQTGSRLKTGAIVLEVGAGAGGILSLFAEGGCKVAGCDFDNRFLEYGRANGVTLYAGNSDTLREQAPADVVILCHVLEHMLDPIGELRKIAALLKPEGVLFIQVPGLDYELFRYHRNGHLYLDFLDYAQSAHTYHFTRSTLRWMVNQAGFSDLSLNSEVTGFFKATGSNAAGELLPYSDTKFSADASARTLRRLQWMESRHQRTRNIETLAWRIWQWGSARLLQTLVAVKHRIVK